MPVQIINPVAQLLQGVLQAHSVANQIRRAAQDEQEFSFRKEMALKAEQRQAQHDQIGDIQTRMQLAQFARPVVGGVITDETDLDVPGVGPLNIGGRTVKASIARKPDAARSVKYKTRDGQELDYELKTPEEQQMDALKRLRATKGVEAYAHLQQLRGEELIKEVSRSMDRASHESIARMTSEGAMERTKATNASRETVARDMEQGATKRAADANTSRERAAGIRASTTEAAADRREARADAKQTQSRLVQLGNEEAALAKEEKRLAEERAAKGSLLKLKPGWFSSNPKDATGRKHDRETVQQQYNAADARYQQVLERKAQITAERTSLQGGGGEKKPGAASASGPIAVNPKTGERVQWNGQGWQRVP